MKAIVIEGSKVTPADVDNVIKSILFQKMGQKIMVCHLTLINGHEIIGMAGVVNPNFFETEIGEGISLDKAKDEVWKHLGSILQNQIASK